MIYTSKKSGFWTGVVLLRLAPPFETFSISVSTSWIKVVAPQDGENTSVSFGQEKRPKQKDLSGFPADLGHNQNGVLGKDVTTATPSAGLLKNPRYTPNEVKALQEQVKLEVFRRETIFS